MFEIFWQFFANFWKVYIKNCTFLCARLNFIKTVIGIKEYCEKSKNKTKILEVSKVIQNQTQNQISLSEIYIDLWCPYAVYNSWEDWGHPFTVLQEGQLAALRNKYWSLNFLQILMIFFLQPNYQFYEFLTIFLIKMAKMVIF